MSHRSQANKIPLGFFAASERQPVNKRQTSSTDGLLLASSPLLAHYQEHGSHRKSSREEPPNLQEGRRKEEKLGREAGSYQSQEHDSDGGKESLLSPGTAIVPGDPASLP